MRSSSKLLKDGFLLSDEIVSLDAEKEAFIAEEETAAVAEELHQEVDLEDVQRQAKRIYAEAQQKAALLIDAAEKDAVKIREKAYREGYEEGLSKARVEHEENLQVWLANFSTALEELTETKKRLADEAHEALLQLLRVSIEKICYTAVDDALILRVLDETLPLIEECTELVVEVNREELDLVTANKHLILQKCVNVKELKIVPSDRVERGGFLATSNTGNIDTTLSTRIDSIIDRFRSREVQVEGESDE